MSRFRYIIFDFDGTLFDTGPGVIRSVRYALSQLGITEDDPAALRRFVGPPLYQSFKSFYKLSDEDATRAVKQFRELYNQIFIDESYLYPGMGDVLRDLRNSGMHLAIATGKPEHFAVPIAEHSGLYPLFDILCGISLKDKGMHKKDLILRVLEHYGSLDPTEVIMIGDRTSDIIGAHDAGVSAMGVRYGYAAEDEIENAGAELIADTPADIRELLLNEC